MTTRLPLLFETALAAILEANNEILRIYDQNQLTVNYKTDESPVTQADLSASAIICSHLQKTDIPIVCEETKLETYNVRKLWKSFWLVDPLDGTKEFISRNGEFTVNIALIQDSMPMLGLISIPAQGILYWGDMINGAHKIDIKDIHAIDYEMLRNQAQKLPCLPTNPDELRIMVSRSHLDELTVQYLNTLKNSDRKVECVAAGSSLKFCYIAEGKADLYLRYSPTMEWDTAAGHAICLASGADMVKLPSKDAFHYNKESLINEGFMVYRNL